MTPKSQEQIIRENRQKLRDELRSQVRNYDSRKLAEGEKIADEK